MPTEEDEGGIASHEREITAQPRDRPPTDGDDVYAALPDLVLVCPTCEEVEPAPADAAAGETFMCAYCGEMAAVEEP